MFWFNELKEFEQKNKNFHVHVTLSQPAASWTGHKGRVLDVFSNIFSDVSQSVIYACGNPQMTLDLKKIAVEKWNVPKEKVHVEGYI